MRWEEERRCIDWAARYWEKARKAGLPVRADFAEFYRDFEWMGAQRQLKVAGIFARLVSSRRQDALSGRHPAWCSEYLLATCRRYRELAPLAHLLDTLAAT